MQFFLTSRCTYIAWRVYSCASFLCRRRRRCCCCCETRSSSFFARLSSSAAGGTLTSTMMAGTDVACIINALRSSLCCWWQKRVGECSEFVRRVGRSVCRVDVRLSVPNWFDSHNPCSPRELFETNLNVDLQNCVRIFGDAVASMNSTLTENVSEHSSNKKFGFRRTSARRCIGFRYIPL